MFQRRSGSEEEARQCGFSRSFSEKGWKLSQSWRAALGQGMFVFKAGTHQSMPYSGGMSHSGKRGRGKVEKTLDGAVGSASGFRKMFSCGWREACSFRVKRVRCPVQ